MTSVSPSYPMTKYLQERIPARFDDFEPTFSEEIQGDQDAKIAAIYDQLVRFSKDKGLFSSQMGADYEDADWLLKLSPCPNEDLQRLGGAVLYKLNEGRREGNHFWHLLASKVWQGVPELLDFDDELEKDDYEPDALVRKAQISLHTRIYNVMVGEMKNQQEKENPYAGILPLALETIVKVDSESDRHVTIDNVGKTALAFQSLPDLSQFTRERSDNPFLETVCESLTQSPRSTAKSPRFQATMEQVSQIVGGVNSPSKKSPSKAKKSPSEKGEKKAKSSPPSPKVRRRSKKRLSVGSRVPRKTRPLKKGDAE